MADRPIIPIETETQRKLKKLAGVLSGKIQPNIKFARDQIRLPQPTNLSTTAIAQPGPVGFLPQPEGERQRLQKEEIERRRQAGIAFGRQQFPGLERAPVARQPSMWDLLKALSRPAQFMQALVQNPDETKSETETRSARLINLLVQGKAGEALAEAEQYTATRPLGEQVITQAVLDPFNLIPITAPDKAIRAVEAAEEALRVAQKTAVRGVAPGVERAAPVARRLAAGERGALGAERAKTQGYAPGPIGDPAKQLRVLERSGNDVVAWETPDGLIIKKIRRGKSKGKWLVEVNGTQFVGLTPDSTLALAREKAKLGPVPSAVPEVTPAARAPESFDYNSLAARRARVAEARLVEEANIADFFAKQAEVPAARAAPEAVTPTKAAEPTITGKPIYDMSYQELDDAFKTAKKAEANIDAEIFGEAGAKRYNALQRRANSSVLPRAQVDAAAREIEQMEARLTSEQKNRLFGIGTTELLADELRSMRDALGRLDFESPERLGQSLASAITRIGAKTSPGQMNPLELEAYAQIRAALKFTQEQGWDRQVVSANALRAAAVRFTDPEDAAFMLERYLRPTPEKPPVLPQLQAAQALPPGGVPQPATAPPPAAAQAQVLQPPVAPSPTGQPPPGGVQAPLLPPTPPRPPVPPVVTGAPPPSPEGFAANIRLSKYPEDIRSTIKEWADANPEAVQAARRGIRPYTEVLADARQLVEDMGGDFAKLQRSWKPGEAWNAEEVTAIRGTLRAKTDRVLEAAQAVKANNSAANHAKLLSAMQDQVRVQEMVHGVTAEAGRALRAFRQEAFDAIRANDNQRLEELLRRVGDRGKMDEVAAAIANLDLANPNAVNEFLRNVTKPKLWDYIMELFINSILSGPKTHIINALSNTVNTLASPVERVMAAAVERVLAPVQGRRVERLFLEVPADALGAIEGLQEGLRAGLSTLRNGINPVQASKWEFRRTAFRGILGRVIRAPGTALETADAMNFAINYRAALNARIMRQARLEGLRGQALIERITELKLAPPESVIKEATFTAEYRLFRQDPGAFTTRLMTLRDVFPPLRFVIPFLRTPVNLVKFGLARSPLGVLNPSLWRNLAAKNPEASDQIARVFLGSLLASLVAWQFAEGRITAAAPKNAAERDRFYREGKLPFAVRIGDTWIQYQRLEPFNQVLAQVAATIQAINEKDKTATEKVEAAVTTMGQNLVSQTYLSGLNDLINMLTQPERYGTQYLTRLATAAVPMSSFQRTLAQALDPTFRRPRTLQESLQAGIPGLSKNVPAVLTAFGEEAPRVSPAWSPIQVSQAQQGAIDTELIRLNVDVGFVGKSIAGEELTREEQQDYQVFAGQATQKGLALLLNRAYYRSLPDLDKESTINRTIEKAREQARAMVMGTPVRGTVEEYVLDIERLQPYWDIGKNYTGPMLAIAAWKSWLKGDSATKAKLKAGIYGNFIRSFEKRQSEQRERLRVTNPRVDAALVRWYGYTPKTKEGSKQTIPQGRTPGTIVPQLPVPTPGRPLIPNIKFRRELMPAGAR